MEKKRRTVVASVGLVYHVSERSSFQLTLTNSNPLKKRAPNMTQRETAEKKLFKFPLPFPIFVEGNKRRKERKSGFFTLFASLIPLFPQDVYPLSLS